MYNIGDTSSQSSDFPHACMLNTCVYYPYNFVYIFNIDNFVSIGMPYGDLDCPPAIQTHGENLNFGISSTVYAADSNLEDLLFNHRSTFARKQGSSAISRKFWVCSNWNYEYVQFCVIRRRLCSI